MSSKIKKIICAASLFVAAFFLVVSIVLLSCPSVASAAAAGQDIGNTTTVPNAEEQNEGYGEDPDNQDTGSGYGRNDDNNNPYYNDYGSTDTAPNASDSTTGTGGFSLTVNSEDATMTATVRMFLILTVIAFMPSILVMLTSFTRTIVVLHFIRAALNTQSSPPNQVMVGIALFLTLFIMWPTFTEINENAIQPLDRGEITQQEFIVEAEKPLRQFMYGQTQTKDLNFFCDVANVTYDDYDDVPFVVLVPAFILSELRTAFIIGFLVYIPFIVIDMVVSSVLMSMGMMMLPPTTVSMPFKILLFVMADGWNLIIGSLIKTFY